MRKLKEVLRLHHELGLGQRQIVRSCAVGQSTVHDYLKRAQVAPIIWPLPKSWDDRCTGLGNPAKTKTPDFHISTAPAAGLYKVRRSQGEIRAELQLTDGGQFKHHNYASVASLQP